MNNWGLGLTIFVAVSGFYLASRRRKPESSANSDLVPTQDAQANEALEKAEEIERQANPRLQGRIIRASSESCRGEAFFVIYRSALLGPFVTQSDARLARLQHKWSADDFRVNFNYSDDLFLEECPDLSSKPFIVWHIYKRNKRTGVRSPVAWAISGPDGWLQSRLRSADAAKKEAKKLSLHYEADIKAALDAEENSELEAPKEKLDEEMPSVRSP